MSCQLPSWTKQTQTWGKINLLYYQSNQTMIMRNKSNLKNTSSHHSSFPGLNFTPDCLYRLLHSGTGDREWWLQSVHHTFSVLLPLQQEASLHRSHSWRPLLPKPGHTNAMYTCIDRLVRAVWC